LQDRLPNPDNIIPLMASSEQAEPCSSRGRIDEVYQRLRSAILNCELPIDKPISQVQLSKDFGVSRTPLREALRMLQREGLITAELNQRVRVLGFSVAEQDQLCALRISIDSLAIRLTVLRLTEEDLQALETNLLQMDMFTSVETYEQWKLCHSAFHRGIIAYAGARTIRESELLMDHAERYQQYYAPTPLGLWTYASSKHALIFEACRARDPQAAAEQIARHHSATALQIIAEVEPEYDPIAIRTALRTVIVNP
jgi:DNA-binding GntR family transcriptional regulator